MPVMPLLNPKLFMPLQFLEIVLTIPASLPTDMAGQNPIIGINHRDQAINHKLVAPSASTPAPINVDYPRMSEDPAKEFLECDCKTSFLIHAYFGLAARNFIALKSLD